MRAISDKSKSTIPSFGYPVPYALSTVVFLILALLLRALLAPLILIATVVLSFLAALGLSALLFKYAFGFAGADPGLPLFVFVFLVALGIVPDRDTAFLHLLSAAGPYHVPHYAPDGPDAVRAIRAAGGVPVFAHPGARAEQGMVRTFDLIVAAAMTVLTAIPLVVQRIKGLRWAVASFAASVAVVFAILFGFWLPTIRGSPTGLLLRPSRTESSSGSSR